jgi:Icc protein
MDVPPYDSADLWEAIDDGEERIGVIHAYRIDPATAHYHRMMVHADHGVVVGSRWIDTIGVDNADAFFAIVDRFPQVRAIVWGHIHQDFYAERNGVALMASPSTCVQFKPRQSDFGLDDMPPGFRWLNLYEDGRIATRVERIEARLREVDLESSGYR